MVQKEQPLSQNDQRVVDTFHRYVRYEAIDTLFVVGDTNDHLLETDLVYVYPRIPTEHLANAKMRFNIDPYIDGLFLCLTLDKHRDVPMDNCVLTTKGLYWWDPVNKKIISIVYTDISMAYPQPDYPKRGVKIARKNGSEIIIKMYLHDALLHALANFFCAANSLMSRSLVDLNNAPAEQIAILPMMNLEKAQRLIAERNHRQGFKKMDQVGNTLEMHYQEVSLLAEHATLKPYRPPKAKARQVDF